MEESNRILQLLERKQYEKVVIEIERAQHTLEQILLQQAAHLRVKSFDLYIDKDQHSWVRKFTSEAYLTIEPRVIDVLKLMHQDAGFTLEDSYNVITVLKEGNLR
jgi:hypothetical protein